MSYATSGYLLLEDGTAYHGRSVAAPGVAFGEAVSTTAMSGYQETVTDPSYAEQLVCFTAPMVGNYGVADERGEWDRPHAKAVLLSCGSSEDANGPNYGSAPTAWSRSRRSTRARSSCGYVTPARCAQLRLRTRTHCRSRRRSSRSALFLPWKEKR